ncbi:MAG: hypothetical protein COB54_05995 [Alphaproteobacteria bacterium]|nr:MAG: hypothetical protein COB54_05995 [Alphaproteobacteria bacterium]
MVDDLQGVRWVKVIKKQAIRRLKFRQHAKIKGKFWFVFIEEESPAFLGAGGVILQSGDL